MPCAVLPDALLKKVTPVPVGSVGFTNWSECGLVDFLVPVDPECTPDRAWNVCVDWDNEIRSGQITGIDRYEGFCDVDAERTHYGC